MHVRMNQSQARQLTSSDCVSRIVKGQRLYSPAFVSLMLYSANRRCAGRSRDGTLLISSAEHGFADTAAIKVSRQQFVTQP